MCLIEKLRLENRTNNLTTEIHLFKGKIYRKILFEFLYILIKMRGVTFAALLKSSAVMPSCTFLTAFHHWLTMEKYRVSILS